MSIEVSSVTKLYNAQKAVNNVSFSVKKGSIVGFLGPNGAGKSTLIKMMVGDVMPDMGTVKMARDLSFSYFDQGRSLIKPDSTIREILCEEGSDHILNLCFCGTTITGNSSPINGISPAVAN